MFAVRLPVTSSSSPAVILPEAVILPSFKFKLPCSNKILPVFTYISLSTDRLFVICTLSPTITLFWVLISPFWTLISPAENIPSDPATKLFPLIEPVADISAVGLARSPTVTPVCTISSPVPILVLLILRLPFSIVKSLVTDRLFDILTLSVTITLFLAVISPLNSIFVAGVVELPTISSSETDNFLAPISSTPNVVIPVISWTSKFFVCISSNRKTLPDGFLPK